MKKLFTLVTIILAMVVSSCTYDDTAVWNKLENHESRISALEELCREMNTNISALQSLVDAMQGGDYITSIVPVTKDGNTIGYTITFAENDPITIYHGTNGKDGANGADGKDGYTPVIGVKQDSDGIYYWTLDGEWLLDDSGNKIKAVGTDGKDGQDGANGADGEDGNDGQDGTDGKDGVDGITPQLKIEEGYWYVSYDNGTSWTQLGKATGEDGQDGANGTDGVNGDAFFANVTVGEESVSFTLADGTEFVVPLVADSLLALLGDISYIPKYTDGKATVTRYADGIILAEFDFSVTPKSMATTIAENYETLLAINAIETVTRAVTLIRMPIVACEADEKSGTISIQASGEFLNPGAFTGDITYSAALTISDGVNSVISDYIELCTYVSTEDSPEEEPELPTDEKIIYYTTSDAAPVKLGATTGFGGILLSNEYDVEANLGKMTFSATVTCIPANAFESSTISTISIPATVTEIGSSAFFSCTSLKSVTIPDSVTSIGTQAFCYCDSLESVTIPDSVTSIGDNAFQNCDSLESFYGKFASEDNRCLIVDGKLIAFAPAGLIEYTIPDSVTSIGDYAFWYCTSLTSVTIPDSVTSIGYGAFENCTSLESVTIGNGVTSIGDFAFYGCSSLESFYGKFASEDNRCLIVDGKLIAFAPAGLIEYTIPDSVIKIGNYAFEDCTSLTSVTIGNSVTSIGGWAFRGCYSLSSVTIPDSVTSIGTQAFSYCDSLASVTIPDSVTSIRNAAFVGCSSLTSFYGKFASEDNRCLIVDGKLIAFAPAGLIEYTIPDSVNSIGDYTFYMCDSLESVTIPDSVTSIGTQAFCYCDSLASVTIGNGVTEIGEGAFYNCTSLTSVTIPDSVTSIGNAAFYSCDSLTSVYCKAATPPAGGPYMFSSNASGRKIYVPTASVEAYKSAAYWSNDASDIVGYEF